MDDLAEVNESAGNGLYNVCCCVWITIDEEDRMHYVWNCREIRKYWKYL